MNIDEIYSTAVSESKKSAKVELDKIEEEIKKAAKIGKFEIIYDITNNVEKVVESLIEDGFSVIKYTDKNKTSPLEELEKLQGLSSNTSSYSNGLDKLLDVQTKLIKIKEQAEKIKELNKYKNSYVISWARYDKQKRDDA